MPKHDVDRDGSRFLMVAQDDSSEGEDRIIVAFNCFEELKLRVPPSPPLCRPPRRMPRGN
jgi:hypothetical protein